MASGQEDQVLYAHHADGYSNLSLFQQNVVKIVTPHIAAAASELSAKVPEFEWVFNDIIEFDKRAIIQSIEDRLNRLPGWRDSSVKLRYVVGSFYTQVVPDNSVDLGVSVSAIDWLSHRPPEGCGADPYNPDEATRAVSAGDWADFLKCRAKELKRGGKLVIVVASTGGPEIAKKESIIVVPRRLVTCMFNEGIISKEEHEFACVFLAPSRSEADVRAPFLDLESDVSQSLRLADIKTFDIPCPLYNKWMEAGGRQNTSATEEFVSDHVNFMKSFYNSFWKILEVTRTREGHAAIMEDFYSRVEAMVRGDLDRYHASESVYVVEIIKD